jgi:Na+/melibiose symporter-like transporter
MYAAAIPVAVSYLLIWNPPTHWSQPAQVAYLVAVAVLIRSFISCYEIPSAALAAELTTEYDERTRLLSYRYLFGWGGGLAMYGLALFVFLKPTAEYPVGQLNPAGYASYGMFAAGLMLFAILVTAIGTIVRSPICGTRRVSGSPWDAWPARWPAPWPTAIS